MRGLLKLTFILLALLSVASQASAQERPYVYYADCRVTLYSGGVYYFRCTKERFAIALGAFREKTGVVIEAMAGDGDSIHGETKGYFVVIRQQ